MHVFIGLQPDLMPENGLFKTIFKLKHAENNVLGPIVNIEVNFWLFFNVYVKK